MIQITRTIPKGLKTNETDLKPRTQIKENIQTTKKNQRTHLKQPDKNNNTVIQTTGHRKPGK